jgi:hypothetical protein
LREQRTHPDSGVLAEVRAGLVTGRRGARISAHLAACERCTGLCGELAEVSALLAAVPAPVMPGAVVRRLEGVLAVEAAHKNKNDAERAVGDSSRHRVASPPPRRGWDFRLVARRVLAPAAAVVLLAAGGYGLSRIGSSPTSSEASSSGAASAASSAHAGPAALPSSRHEAAQAIGTGVEFGVVTSRIDYLRASLPQQLESELRRYQRAPGSVQEIAPASVVGCVRLVTSGISPETLLLVEKAHFQGQPANVIVAMRGDRDVAWVTTPACSGSSDYVLDTATLPGTSAS